jgi:hypothetical protein
LRSTLSLLGSILLTLSVQEASGQDKTEREGQPAPAPQKPEKLPQPSSAGVGVLEVPRPDGGKDKIYYSTTTQEEERQRSQEEKENADRSWEMLRNVIIDKRWK